ncbi:glycosyl hydrolase family 17 protein [Tenacibaculum tangerinum]|uniref:Glycosyl hydrolase family 17 protein n=1 Tax=Tenacibaculum tangerinum TaxID=3038772 RepID=A0ABY8L6A5_9FLAO|nr:glycosyl hydrolase family 17 protein [Tenacibaculum tangerinum]WGH75720.1 glycosyl hydrolase family 17 protein [Tenacibaculum tangerinum]
MNNSLFNGTVGVNFSNTFQSAATRVSATTAATQIKATGVKTVKMFTYNQAACISAFAKEGLEVLVDIPNGDLQACANNDTTTINTIVDVLSNNASSIPMICVGNEPLGSWWNNAYASYLVKALTNIKSAIATKGLTTKVTVPFNYAIMGNSYPPSAGAFNHGLKNTILDICAILKADNSVFMVNVYPFLTHNSQPNNIPLDYCLFTANSNPGVWVHDNGYTYKNIFDAMYDALLVALENNGYGSLPIVIGEAGWPAFATKAYPSATVANAQTFNQNLINHCKSGNGTPRNPNVEIPCFLFEMYDENLKPTNAGAFEQHWGVYGYNTQSKNYQAKYSLTW